MSELSSGYAIYSKHLLSELVKNPEYEVAEMATFVHPQDQRLQDIKWAVYPNVPKIPMEQFEHWKSNQHNMWGGALFDDIALDFKPDIVCTHSDWWMRRFVNKSPYKKCFKHIWLMPCDSMPQDSEWIEDALECDGLLTYTDWAKEVLVKQCSKLKIYGSAPNSAQSNFQPLDKRKVKESLGLNPNLKFIGTVMRNQVRKLFPDLFLSYRQFLDQTKRKDVYLYCHTTYPDGSWRIPELIQEFGIQDRVFFTYICQNCRYCFPSLYADIATCKNCGQIASSMPNTAIGVPSEYLCNIYNLMDVYVQYSIAEGLGMSQIEAAACMSPIMSVDYSGMSDVVRKLGGTPIKVKRMYREINSNAYRALPDNDHFVECLTNFFNKPDSVRQILGIKARKLFEQHYRWDKTAQTWSELIDSLKGPSLWNQPAKIHRPAQLNGQDELSAPEYARFLLRDVAGMPEKIGTHSELILIRDLNYQRTTGSHIDHTIVDSNQFNHNKTHPFSREIAYKMFYSIAEGRAQAEMKRMNSIE